MIGVCACLGLPEAASSYAVISESVVVRWVADDWHRCHSVGWLVTTGTGACSLSRVAGGLLSTWW